MRTWTVIFALVLGTTVWAQEGKHRHHMKMTPEQRAEKMTARLTEELNLNESQQASVYAINLKYTPQFKALREKDLPREEMQKAMKPLKKAMAKEYKEVLTDDQWQTFKANKKARREARKEHHKKGECSKEKKCEPKACDKHDH